MKPPAPVTSTLVFCTAVPLFAKRTFISPTSTRPGPAHHSGHRSAQDGEVLRQRPAVDVLEVERDPVAERQRAATADLPQTGQAGTDAESPHIRRPGEPFDIAQRQRPRTNHRHLATQ